MYQPRPTSYSTPLLGCLLAISAVGCQTYAPSGYGAPGNYSYPVYQPGTVMPYNGPTNGVPGGFQGGRVIPPGQTFPQPGMFPQNGMPGGYPNGQLPPGVAPPFNPQANPNYQLPPVNQNPGNGTNLQPGGIQGADVDGATFGQPGQFPNSPNSQRPKMPAEERLAVPMYDDPSAQSGTTAPVNNTKPRTAPPANFGGPEDFNGDLEPGKRATQKLKESEDEPAVPAAAVPKKTSMIIQDTDGSTQEFMPPLDTQLAQQGVIQTAQHIERAPVQRPYGRAANGHGWFRGVVDFDQQEKTWYLIYNPTPDESDARGGIVTLLEHPNLQFLRSDDTVLVEGIFEPAATDRYGHPKYRINTVKRLVAPQ
ncbi:MAG: hypothetical protein JWM11_2308 [Planctomycetaceae bacterium]|nr:hypothetical protein [Planctomycetaceae bacterium]